MIGKYSIKKVRWPGTWTRVAPKLKRNIVRGLTTRLLGFVITCNVRNIRTSLCKKHRGNRIRRQIVQLSKSVPPPQWWEMLMYRLKISLFYAVCGWSLNSMNLINIRTLLCKKHRGNGIRRQKNSCRNPFPHSHYERCWCNDLKNADSILCVDEA